jgi:hypothetical protein
VLVRKLGRSPPGTFELPRMTALSALKHWILSTRARRAQHRKLSTMGVRWRVFGSSVHHLSVLGDVSPGGALLRAADPRPVGSPIVLDLATRKGLVTVHARVAWAGSPGMGLRFTRLMPELT